MTIKGSWLHPHESNILSDIDFAALPFKAASSCPSGPFLRLDRFLEVSLWPAKLVQLQCVLDLHQCDQMVSFQLGFHVDEEDRNTGSRASTERWLHYCVENKKYYPCTVSTCSVAHAMIPWNTSPEMLWDFAKNTLHTLKDVSSVQMIQGAATRKYSCVQLFFFF